MANIFRKKANLVTGNTADALSILNNVDGYTDSIASKKSFILKCKNEGTLSMLDGKTLYNLVGEEEELMEMLDFDSACKLLIYASNEYSTSISSNAYYTKGSYPNSILKYFLLCNKSKHYITVLTEELVKGIIDDVCYNKNYKRYSRVSDYLKRDLNFLIKCTFDIVNDHDIRDEICKHIEADDNTLEDETLDLLVPYMLNQELYYKLFKMAKDIKHLKLYVLASKDKKIIARYIYESQDDKLLFDLFGHVDKYLDYCMGVFADDLYKKIKTWIFNKVKYKYVDDKIEKLLKSSNESIDINIKKEL